MKTTMKNLAILAMVIFAILALTSCSENNDVKPVQPKKADTLNMVTTMKLSSGNSGYPSTYKVNYDANNAVSSIDYLSYDGSDGGTPSASVRTTFTWSADHRTLEFTGTDGAKKKFEFTADSMLAKVTGSTYSAVRTFNYNGKKLISITDSNNGSADRTDVINYNADVLAGMTYQIGSPDKFTVSVNSAKANPIMSITCPELMALVYEIEFHEIYFMTANQIDVTNWGNADGSPAGNYDNWNHTYKFDTQGRLTNIDRKDNYDLDQPMNSNISLEWNQVIVK